MAKRCGYFSRRIFFNYPSNFRGRLIIESNDIKQQHNGQNARVIVPISDLKRFVAKMQRYESMVNEPGFIEDDSPTGGISPKRSDYKRDISEAKNQAARDLTTKLLDDSEGK